MRIPRSLLVLISLFLVALATYAKLWQTAPLPGGDTQSYQEVAADLSDLQLDQVHYRTVGYPLLLVATGSVDTPTRALFYVSLVCHFAAVAFLLLVLSKYDISWWGRALCALVLLLPPFVEPAGYALSENLTEFLVCIGFSALALSAIYDRVLWAATAALALALSALVRPTYQFIGIAIALSLALLSTAFTIVPIRRFKSILVALVLGNIVIVGGCAATNQAKFGYFGLTPGAGINLSTKTALFIDDLPARYGPVKRFLVTQRDSALIAPGSAHTAEQYMWDLPKDRLAELTGLSGVALQKYILRFNLTLIRIDPLKYLQHVLRATGRQLLPASGRLANDHSRILQLVWAALHFCVLAVFLLQLLVVTGLMMFAATLPRTAKLRRTLALHVRALFTYVAATCIILYTVAVTALMDIGDPRQRRPVDALVVFATILGFHIWHVIGEPMRRDIVLTTGEAASTMSVTGESTTSNGAL